MNIHRPFAVLPRFPDTSLVVARTGTDPETALASVSSGLTVVTVTFSPVTATTPETVAVFSDGNLIELGDADRLTGAGGTYARLRRAWRTGASA